jgi:hypothetical protein
MGIVVPYERIIEVLEMPKAKAARKEILAGRQTPAARLESVAKPVPPANGENPTHRDAAARKQEPEG